MTRKSFLEGMRRRCAQGFDLVFPPCCILCQTRIFHAKQFLCGACQDSIIAIEAPYCKRCGQSLPYPAAPCNACCGRTFYFESAFSAFGFDGPLQKVMHQLKYGFRPGLGRFMGTLLAQRVAHYPGFDHVDVLVPVPLHPRRKRERGYNQSELIAQGLSAEAGLPIATDCLLRSRHTPSQTTLTPDARIANVKGAFDLVGAEALRGRSVALIDDVFTTGATINSAARALYQKGAGQVFAMTIARA